MAEQQSNTASDSSRLIVDDAFEVAPVNDRLFGSFVEHLGRCVSVSYTHLTLPTKRIV